MNGVWHPVGPEPAGRYWLRRALVLAVLALVAVVVTALASPGTGRQRAVPAAAVSTAPVLDATPSPNVATVPSGSVPSTSKPATSGAAHSAGRAHEAGKAGKVTANKAAANKAAAKPKSSAANRPSKPAQPVSCDGSELRTTLTGHEQLKTAQSAPFRLSVLNLSPGTCLVSVTAHSFELKIFSGQDRIWSTRDCSTAVTPRQQELASGRAMGWQLSWDGRRSAAGCKARPETPRPGTYVATAQLEGAEPVRLRMILHL